MLHGIAVAMVLVACAVAAAQDAEPSTPRWDALDGYVSSNTCRACHPGEHASWAASFHRTMTQAATPTAVVAPFTGEVVARGVTYRLHRRDDRFEVTMPDPAWTGPPPAPEITRPIVLTTGSHHEQDYWYPTGHARALAHLPIVYRIAEQRWLPNGSTFMQPHSGQGGPEGRPEDGGWNRNCIQCHTTSGRPRFESGGPDTVVAELGIACEACHGPGEDHVARNENPVRRYLLHLGDRADASIVNPARLSSKRSADLCGQCHMVSTVTSPAAHPDWNAHGPRFRPGDDLASSRDVLRPRDPSDPAAARARTERPALLANTFWSDGMIRVTGREFNGLIESPCYERGEMSCMSCHRMHRVPADARPLSAWTDDQLAPGLDGDEACLQCHPALRVDLAAHTHHAAGSDGSRCMNCHMPNTTYGLLKATRSHQVSSPSVAVSIATGRPNACNLCHLDRPLGWAAQTLESWYGIAAPALDADEQTVSAGVRWLLAGDAGQRAIVAWSMGWAPAQRASPVGGDARWMVPLLAQLLADPYEAVRLVAADALRQHTGRAVAGDLLQPVARLRAVRDASVNAWKRSRRPAPGPEGARVLLAPAGDLDHGALARWIATRDDRRVELWE